ncbi:MAG: T9SS type A sorting domain-containing protein, partial [Bacteroidota bacterium]
APYQVAIYKFEISTSTTSSTANGNREAKIHPNPGSFVHIESPFESFRIDILSTDGKTMLTTTVQGHNGEVDLSKLPQGIYFCQLTDLKSTQRISKKIIKN